jgi:hypothetical protein
VVRMNAYLVLSTFKYLPTIIGKHSSHVGGVRYSNVFNLNLLSPRKPKSKILLLSDPHAVHHSVAHFFIKVKPPGINMNQKRRHTLPSVVSLSRLLLFFITASSIIVASSGASRMTQQMPQKAVVAETVMADSSVVNTAGTSSTNVQRGLGRNLQEAATT